MSATDLVLSAGSRTVTAALVGRDDGWPVLFFHGSPGCRLQARRLEAAAAARGARLIALDRPGCGRTSPAAGGWNDQLIADAGLTLDHLNVRTAPVLAVSGGVAAALIAASALQARLDRIVIASGLGLVNGRALLDGASPSNKLLSVAARRGPTTARLALAPPYLASRLVPIGSLPAGDDRLHDLLREMRETFARGTRGPARDLVIASRVDQLDLAAVQQPVVAWHGSRDRYAPLPAMRALVDRLPNASLRLVEDGDHFIFESHADEMLAALTPSGQAVHVHCPAGVQRSPDQIGRRRRGGREL